FRGIDVRTGEERWRVEAAGAQLVAPFDDGSALGRARKRTLLLRYADGAILESRDEGTEFENLLAARDGKVVLESFDGRALVYYRKWGGLRVADLTDRPGLGAPREHRRFTEPVSAAIDGRDVVIVSLNGSISFFHERW